VALLHVTHSLSGRVQHGRLGAAAGSVPGVPIFFFISGLLLSRSYERSGSLKDYALNRTLRIFRAARLRGLNIIAVAATGYFGTSGGAPRPLRRCTSPRPPSLQFYNPTSMRGFGDGV